MPPKIGENYSPKSSTCQGDKAPEHAGTIDRQTGRPRPIHPMGKIDQLKGDPKNGNRNGSMTVKSIRIEGYGPPHNCASRIQSVDHPTAPQHKAESPNTCVLRRRRSRLSEDRRAPPRREEENRPTGQADRDDNRTEPTPVDCKATEAMSTGRHRER